MRAWCVLIALASGGAAAQDYLNYKMVSSSGRPFDFYIDSRSNRPADLDQAAMRAAVERSWDTWNSVQCAVPKVQSRGLTGATVADPQDIYDEFSVVPVWMLNDDEDLLQIVGNSSTVVAITLPRAYAGLLLTCDTFFNGARFAWFADPGAVPTGTMDVETVALHESGHCLGLGHFGTQSAVMNPTVSRGEQTRSLAAIDAQKLCERYPLAGESGSPCFGDGGCAAPDLRCLQQPESNGLTFSLCVRGCIANSTETCELPLFCQPSSAFADIGLHGACMLAGSINTKIGRPCASPATCTGSVESCLMPRDASGGHQFWAQGYCTQSCDSGEACPPGSECTSLEIGKRCLQNCRVGMADCRAEYACAQTGGTRSSGVCLPRCYSDQDCANPTAFSCRTCDGLCVPRQNLTGQLGDPCVTDATCGEGQVCRLTDSSSPEKQCTRQCSRGCGLCPTGSTCTPVLLGELVCLRDCTGPGTCPVGMRCAETPTGRGCQPPCHSNDECPVGQACFSGECFTPTEDGGCGALCQRVDSGMPIEVPIPDAGTGTGKNGGCGCTSVDPMSIGALVGLMVLRARRRV